MSNQDKINKIEFVTGEENIEREPLLDQESQFEIYVSDMEGAKALVNVDLALFGTAPVPRLPWLFGLKIEMQEPDEDGFYTEEEEKRLQEIQTRACYILQEEGYSKFVGSLTYDGNRMLYFYGKDENYLPPLVGKIAAEFSDYEFNFMLDKDGAWQFYLEGLYPSEVDLAHIKNRHMLSRLAESGFDLDKEYPVSYYFYFQDGASRGRVASELLMNGFEIIDDKIYVEDLEPMSLGLRMLARHKLDYLSVTEKTYECFEALDEKVGIYDGWELTSLDDLAEDEWM